MRIRLLVKALRYAYSNSCWPAVEFVDDTGLHDITMPPRTSC